jgi:hypothetical protein
MNEQQMMTEIRRLEQLIENQNDKQYYMEKVIELQEKQIRLLEQIDGE